MSRDLGGTKRRKGAPMTSTVTAAAVPDHLADEQITNNNNNTIPSGDAENGDPMTTRINNTPVTHSKVDHIMADLQKEQKVLRAKVRRRWLGTGAFDQHWLNMDCCGLTCAMITYGLHLFGIYAVNFVLLPPWMSIHTSSTWDSLHPEEGRIMTHAGFLHQSVFALIAGMAIWSHFQAMTTNPGAVPPDAKPLPEMCMPATNTDMENNGTNKPPSNNLRLCRRCKAFKPQRAHHCSICKRCVIKMDHHCPWVNNCVGIGNHKYFLLFVFYTFISCLYSMILVIIRFSSCVHARRHHHRLGNTPEHAQMVEQSLQQQQHQSTCVDHPSQLLTILLLLVEALLFGIFTSCMMFDQMEVVQNKLTHIDRLKGIRVGGNLAGIAEVFGVPQQQMNKKRDDASHAALLPEEAAAARFRFDWLLPWVRGACFPANLQDEIMGFCVGKKHSPQEDDEAADSELSRRRAEEASGLTDIV